MGKVEIYERIFHRKGADGKKREKSSTTYFSARRQGPRRKTISRKGAKLAKKDLWTERETKERKEKTKGRFAREEPPSRETSARQIAVAKAMAHRTAFAQGYDAFCNRLRVKLRRIKRSVADFIIESTLKNQMKKIML